MSQFYENRRNSFLEKLGPTRVAIISGNSQQLRNGTTHYSFRQSSNLSYLTDFPEPEAIAVFTPGRLQTFTLFVRPRNDKDEIYSGPRKGLKEAMQEYGAHQSFPIEEFENRLPLLLDGYAEVVFPIGTHSTLDFLIPKTIAGLRSAERKGRRAPYRMSDLRCNLHELRLFKDEEGLRCLRRASEITKEAHLRAMRTAHGAGMTESQLSTLIDFTFQINNGSPGYENIVAAFGNANILHYVHGKSPLSAQNLVLVDAGCEWQGFTADVTRTFPVRSEPGQHIYFSTAQRRVYNWVLKAQLEGIRLARPGSTLDAIYEICREILIEGMIDLGLLHGNARTLLQNESYQRFLPHLTSHWLGLDVHDVGEYYPGGEARILEDGMVFTIEPGLYIPNSLDIPEEYRGIGIRIEDDVLISSKNSEGHEILSSGIPKTVEEIEVFLNNDLTLLSQPERTR